MSRRTIERVALALGVVVLGFVLVSATFVDRRPPGVARISLSSTAADGSTALTHATVDVEFTEPVEQASVESRFRITPSVPGVLSWSGDRVLIFTPSRKLPVATEFAVHLERGFRDREGNLSATDVAPFTFRTVDLPAVSASLPAEGDDDVPLEGPLTLTFDRLMDTELTTAAVRLEPGVPLEPSWRGTMLELTPTAPLDSGTAYKLTLGREATDVDGNGLVRPFVLHFSTVTTGLLVGSLLPTDGSAGSAPLSPIAIVFDRPIDPGSITGALTITPPVEGTLEVVGLARDAVATVARLTPVESPSEAPATSSAPATAPSSSPSAASPPATSPSPTGPARVLRFTPNGPLAAHTTYTVRLRPGAVRALGTTQVAEGRTWTFTTGSTADQLQNQVLFRSDRTGITNVWAMNPDGTNARQLTAELTPVTSYDIGVDGRTLVYATAGSIKRLLVPGGSVTPLSHAENADYQPRLRPGSDSVLVARRDRLTGRDGGLWLVPLAGGPDVQVLRPGCLFKGEVAPPPGSSEATDDAYAPNGRPGPWSTTATFSADGTVLLLACDSGDLLRLDLVTATTTVLGLREPVGPPVWSVAKDGFVVAATGIGGRVGTWFVSRSGVVSAGPELGAWPSVDAAGALAGISATQPDRLAYLPPGGAIRVLTLATDLLDRQPQFSPAGDAILFVRVLRDDPGRSAGIWLVARDGRELRQLAPTGSDPRWLP